jgi:hypothetical protein
MVAKCYVAEWTTRRWCPHHSVPRWVPSTLPSTLPRCGRSSPTNQNVDLSCQLFDYSTFWQQSSIVRILLVMTLTLYTSYNHKLNPNTNPHPNHIANPNPTKPHLSLCMSSTGAQRSLILVTSTRTDASRLLDLRFFVAQLVAVVISCMRPLACLLVNLDTCIFIGSLPVSSCHRKVRNTAAVTCCQCTARLFVSEQFLHRCIKYLCTVNNMNTFRTCYINLPPLDTIAACLRR